MKLRIKAETPKKRKYQDYLPKGKFFKQFLQRTWPETVIFPILFTKRHLAFVKDLAVMKELTKSTD